MRADIRAEHEALLELRKIEGPRPKAIPDWPLCENCGQPYGYVPAGVDLCWLA